MPTLRKVRATNQNGFFWIVEEGGRIIDGYYQSLDQARKYWPVGAAEVSFGFWNVLRPNEEE